MRGFLVLLDGDEREDLSAHQLHALDAIRANVNRLDAMIANLLQLVETHEGSYTPILEPVPVGRFVEEFLGLRNHLKLRDDFAVELDEAAAEDEVLLDRNRFHLVLNNLLDNAHKFCRAPGGGDVILRIRRQGSEVLLEVHDDGIGIADTLGERVFERFTQADMSSTREYQGVGLGLAVVRAVVGAHGGTVKLVPPVLGGTSVQVALPVPAAGGGR
jgi:signal transduction histidine kinase